jgi:Trk K+ transport system NAD-binding subunit
LTLELLSVDQLLIAEATAAGTPLVGKTLRQSGLREEVGISVVGVWERGRFETAGPDTRISPHTVLVLAGSEQQLHQYDARFCMYNVSDEPIVILGGGRVGRATRRALEERGLDYRIVEQLPEHIHNTEKYIIGNAAAWEVLHTAGIMKAPMVVITTHNDDINIYLTIYCRPCVLTYRSSAGPLWSVRLPRRIGPGLILSCPMPRWVPPPFSTC